MKSVMLAGGASSRFGGKPKGLERIGGERIADRTLRSLQAATGTRPLIIANDEEAADWFRGFEVIPDVPTPPLLSERDTPEPGQCGSLGGIYTAVSTHQTPVLVLAWDMPFVPVDLLAALSKLVEGHDVALPASNGPLSVEPCCAVYGPKCVEAIKVSLEREDYRATAFHEAVDVVTMPLNEVERYGEPDTLFFNVNTPKDLEKAEELWRQAHG
jgi:molybdopterin-guanine dinucleotide biosynthesis protein A